MRLATTLVALSLVGSSLAASETQNTLSSCKPVTETITVSICPASAVDSAIAKSFSTITSYSTLTNYVTVVPSQSVVGPASSSDDVLPTGSGYSYIVHDGTTSWINGASPTGSFSETLTKTIQVTVFPSPSGNSEVTITQTKVVTITPPAVTSFMAQSTDALADSADGETATSTVTSYSTKSVISVLTVYMSSRSSKSVALMTSSHSVHTVTGPPTSTTVTVEFASTSESVCSVSYVDVTTDLTYTVFATPSAGFTSVTTSAGNLSSLAWAASAWNATRPTLTGSMHKPSGSGATIALTGSLVSSMSVGDAARKTATAVLPIVASSAYRHGKNASSTLASATGYVPFMPVPAISLSASAAFSRTSSTLTKMYTNNTSSMPTPAVCGEHGKFTLTWDDEPNFLPTEPITEASQAPPVSNPYHHMYFSDGFVYAPPPSLPFLPISSPRLVMFVANETDNHNEGGQLPGEIGAGRRRSSSAFWFDAHSVYLGCDNLSAYQCELQITGLVYHEKTKSEVAAFHQTVSLLPCLLLDHCELQKVNFDSSMKGLSGIRILASANDEPVNWFMDNLTLGWSNNTCAAGLLRGSSQ